MKVYYNGIFGQQDIKLVRDIINIVSLNEMFSLMRTETCFRSSLEEVRQKTVAKFKEDLSA